MPPRSLANDLMTFYAPDRMYTEGMTVMEMICCSPCITSMICFSLEVKFQSDAEEKPRQDKLFDSAVGFHDGRLAARGNATSFMLPWQGILQELRQLEKEERRGNESTLPHVGERLGSAVQILLKINDATTKDSLPRFIHQANVRRDVVKRHIKMMEKTRPSGVRTCRPGSH